MRSPSRPAATDGRRPGTILAALSFAVAFALAPFALNPEANAEVPSDDPQVQGILEQDENLDYLGTPVTSQIPSQAGYGVEDGRHVSYQVFKGAPDSDYPATFAVTDVETGAQLNSCTVDGAEHSRNLNVANDGRVYWGTYYDSKLWRYDPATGECADLGKISDSEENDHAFGISPGPDGSMYLGVYPDSRLYLLDPETDEIELVREIDPGADYIHSIAYHEETDTVYVGSGGVVPQIWKIEDGGRGEQTLIADESTAPGLNEGATSVGRMDIVHDRVIAQVGLRMIVLDLDGNIIHWDSEQTRFFFGHHIIPGADPGTAIFSNGSSDLVVYDVEENSFHTTAINIGDYLSHGVIDDSSGTPLLYGTSATGVFVADLESETLLSENSIDFAQPTLIQEVLNGPDDTIWASGYMIGLAEVDKTGAEHGETMQQGQYESSVVRDGKLYLGAYGHSKLEVLDPATYDPADPSTVEQIFESQHEGQDRPFGMAYNPERDEIYMGSVAIYGQTQGGLAIWDGATSEHVWLTEEIGADENVVSVAYNENDGMVYLGTTVDGGLGSDPSGNTAGKLIVFDPETRSVVEAIDPVGEEREGITGLVVDDQGAVWGVAEDALFTYEPTTGTSEVKGSVGGTYTEGTTYWAYGNISQSAADGKIYVTAGSRFSVHDPETGETTRIADGVGWSTTDESGDVYVSAGAHLFRYNVPEAGLVTIIGAEDGEELAEGTSKEVRVRVDDPEAGSVTANLSDETGEVVIDFGEIALVDGLAHLEFTVPERAGEELVLTVTAGGSSHQVSFEVVKPYQAPQPPFTDVPFGIEHYEAMAWMKDIGISTGWADGTYRPLEPVNRDAMTAFLHRLAGEPEVDLPEASPFTDVVDGDEHYEAMVWASQNGIATGWADGTFRPTEPIKRDAMAAFVHRYAGAPEFEAPATSPFADVPTSDLFYEEMAWMYERELATGWADGTYRPLQDTNRDATAAFLFRMAHEENIVWVPLEQD